MKTKWLIVCGLIGASCGVVGCEVRNTLEHNREVTALKQKAEAKAPTTEKPMKAPPVLANKLATPKTPKGLSRAEINARLQAAMKKRAEQGAPPFKAPALKSPERPLTSAAFTKLKPDGAETAKKPPVAEDLARYTSDLKGSGALTAKIVTNMGDLICELYEEQSPVTVANFVGLARGLKAWNDPFTNKPLVGVPLYQNVLFHRVIPGFMIQGGDPLGTGRGNPGYQIPDEFDKSLSHDSAGLLSMANSGPKSGGSQFFVTDAPTRHLDNKHTIFGKCAQTKVVSKIAGVKSNAMKRPDEDVKIEKIVILRAKK